ncbi:MAG: hypothetical protein LBH51_05140 [Treponema sp.]|nr:hypothetical protein [Treponema sp.]
MSALEEQTLSMGGEHRWQGLERRAGITEFDAARPWPVLVLASGNQAYRRPESAGNRDSAALDLALSFDEDSPESFRDREGRYAVNAAPGSGGALLSSAGPRWARQGEGAAFFSAAAGPRPDPGLSEEEKREAAHAGPLVVVPQDPEALFAAGRRVRDFSLEFWLYPLNMENGEEILNWTASRPRLQGGYYFQHIRCTALKNRLNWNFSDFFTTPDGEETLNIILNGSTTVIPKSWSHHLIRFDGDTGLLEYLVNGSIEAVAYTTAAQREGGEVYTPVIGPGGEFILGRGYTGLLDEFRIHSRYAGAPGREFGLEGSIQKYPAGGGRVETRAFDLGPESADILRLETRGGRINLEGKTPRNAYAGGGRLSFADDSAIQFFMRIGDNPYRWTDADWRVVEPGIDLPPIFQGRYVQIAADFYPSADGETSPYLEELRILYRPNEPPRPPTLVTAQARDGAVELNWRGPAGEKPDGYLVYYGRTRGEYFEAGALQGPSPIDAGTRTSLRIEGLNNGTLYYFAVASYRNGPDARRSGTDTLRIGDFSREATARPLPRYTFSRDD